MTDFTVLDGDFKVGSYQVLENQIMLEDRAGRQRTYYLDTDLKPVAIKAIGKDEMIFLVTTKDGKKFTAKADKESFKGFMAKVGQPVLSEKKAGAILLMIGIGIFFLLRSCMSDEVESSAPPTVIVEPQIEQSLLSPEEEYFAILSSEIANIEMTNIKVAVQDRAGVIAGLDRIKTWAKLYEEHKKYVVTDPEKLKLIVAFKSKVSAHQKNLFPRLREIQAKVMKENAWEHDIDVKVYGEGSRKLQITGGTFITNANIKTFMDATYASLEPFRYKRIGFRWDKQYGSETFYDLKPLGDGELKP